MNRSKSIFIRVSDNEKIQIRRCAKKCGLSLSEYIRKVSLGYTPKEMPTDAFYEFYSKLNEVSNGVSSETESKLINLIDEISVRFLEDRR